MGGEKRGSKSGGFFHLFDWNRKSRKKLFSSESSSPERIENGKRAGESMLHSQLGLINEDEIMGAASVKGSSDYSCASSVTDDDGHTVKAPGVVARLMGLDSLPASGVSDSYTAPFFDSKSLCSNRSNYVKDQIGHSIKPVSLRTQKMPSSPIERFQTEMLPPRSAKSIPITHHKLLSPIKNSGFISPVNAAHIMEAAVKILEPGLQNSISRSRTPLFGTSSVPLKLRDMKDISPAPQRPSRLPTTAKRVVDSNSLRSLKGQSLNKSWNGSDDTSTSKSSLDVDECNPGGLKGKGKSVSLAVQAKVNVQQREDVTVGNKNTGGRKTREQCELSHQFISQSHNRRNTQLRKSFTASTSSVLRQNNQKQNSIINRDKLLKNKPPRDAASAKNKAVNNAPGSSKVSYRKVDLLTADFDRDGLMSGTRNYPRKKRLIERESYSSSSRLVDNKLTDGPEIFVQQNVVIDEHSSCLDDNGTNCSDIVSFTFTSPLVKSISQSKISSRTVGICDKRKGYCSSTSGEKSTVCSSNKEKLSPRSNVLDGDALSLLLEQKLKDLASRLDLSSCDLLSSSNNMTTFQEPTSGPDPVCAPIQRNKVFLSNCSAGLSFVSDSAISSTTDQDLSTSNSLQEAEQANPSHCSGAAKENHQPSPVSILDASFSNESCNSSESWESTGSKLCSLSVQAQEISCLDPRNPAVCAENEFDFSDSASSSLTDTMYDEVAVQTSRTRYTKESKQELEYVREIIRKNGSLFERTCKTLEPSMFDILEHKVKETETTNFHTKSKILFDCVNECLDMKCSRFFKTGYRSWSKGVTMTGAEVAEELYKEVVQWKRMGASTVDDRVDKDMSTQLGRWVDFEIEAFEAGTEVEKDVFDGLVDEVVCDILSKRQ